VLDDLARPGGVTVLRAPERHQESLRDGLTVAALRRLITAVA